MTSGFEQEAAGAGALCWPEVLYNGLVLCGSFDSSLCRAPADALRVKACWTRRLVCWTSPLVFKELEVGDKNMQLSSRINTFKFPSNKSAAIVWKTSDDYSPNGITQAIHFIVVRRRQTYVIRRMHLKGWLVLFILFPVRPMSWWTGLESGTS
ncbi:hypothetical protein GGR52DRAFT_564155 [Hypoxylon sp. FL1284]|nr:hypothetical protein GGR52DRAFT_564155 [Hypoxylon sp. FL1284]